MDNLLLSFPRSGNGWVRYILEYLTKRPSSMGTLADCQEGSVKTDTMNLSSVDTLRKCIAIKRHRADNSFDNWTKDNTNLIFLLRDWREACLRHLTQEQRENADEVNKCVEGYNHCLRFYDEFAGNKTLVYYEDLILNPKAQVDKIVDFLQIERGAVYDEFWKNFAQHRANSVVAYAPGSVTQGAPNKLKFHSKRASSALIKSIDDGIKKESVLYDKYLKRYE